MCNLTENPNDFESQEDLMNDPQYLAYMELQHQQMAEYLDAFTKSIENKIDIEKDPYELTNVNF